MAISEVHLVVRPEINSIKDLEGKKVSFHIAGAGSSTTAPIVFKRLGIKVEPVYINNAIALEKMKTGEIAGARQQRRQAARTCSPSSRTIRASSSWPIPFDKFDEYYVPAVLTSEDYPGFIKPGEKVETLGVQTVLAVYNWPSSNDRFRRVQRFIEYYFERFEGLHKPPYHPKWKSVNLAANVPGWTRYCVADERLKQMAAAKAPPQQPPGQPPAGRQQAARARLRTTRRAGAAVPAVPGMEQEAGQVTRRSPMQSAVGSDFGGTGVMPSDRRRGRRRTVPLQKPRWAQA